jgi:hypothetical protein
MTEYTTPRELKSFKTGNFSGWGCTSCGWHIASDAAPSDKTISRLVKEFFGHHRCKGHPRRKENSGSDPD